LHDPILLGHMICSLKIGDLELCGECCCYWSSYAI